MPPPTDKQLATTRAWPAGIDNRNEEQALARDDRGAVVALRDAENVDLDRQGKPKRRAGYRKIVGADGAHSLWGDPGFPFGLYVDAGRLLGLRADGEAFEIADGLGLQPVSYALAAGAVYWSSASQHGKVTADGVPGPWGIVGPRGAPFAVSTPNGGLHAGRYQVTATFLSAAGEESGAPEAARVDVAEGDGIALAGIPQPPDPAWRIRVYASPANGDVLYSAITMPAGSSAALITAHQPGKPLATQFLDVLPPGHVVRWFNGRLYIAVGNVLVWSEALRYGLTRIAHNRLGMPARIDMVEPMGEGDEAAGLFVAADERTYWLPGTDPKAFRATIARAHGVVPGTPIRVPGDVFKFDGVTKPVVYWLDTSGTGCVGLPDGTVLALRADQATAPSADRGASLYRDGGGMRQIITALGGARERGVAIGDKAECTVVRHDA